MDQEFHKIVKNSNFKDKHLLIHQDLQRFLVSIKFDKTGREQVNNFCLIKHLSHYYMIWQFFTSIIYLINIAVTPLFAVFRLTMTSQIFFFFIIIDSVVYANLIIGFFTSYTDKDGINIMEPKKIIKHYLKTNFALNLISVFPFEILSEFILISSLSRDDIYLLFRMNRMFLLVIVFRYLHSKIISLGIKALYWYIYQLFVILVFSLHIGACLWYAIACFPNCRAGSWLDKYLRGYINTLDNSTESVLFVDSLTIKFNVYIKHYIISIYFMTATFSTEGNGIIVASTHFEGFIVAIFLLIGVFGFYGYFIGSASSLLSNLTHEYKEAVNRISITRIYLRDRGIPTILSGHCLQEISFMLMYRHTSAHREFFEYIPNIMQTEIHYALKNDIVSKLRLFKETSSEFRRMLCCNLFLNHCLPGTEIIKPNIIEQKCIFIFRGKVEVFRYDENLQKIHIKYFEKNQHFGELRIILSEKSQLNIRAVTYCDYYIFEKSTVNKLCYYYPKDMEQIFKEHVNMLEEYNDIVISTPEHRNSTKRSNIYRFTYHVVYVGRLRKVLKKFLVFHINPNSLFYRIWQMVVVVASLIVGLMCPFMAAFTPGTDFEYFGANGYGILIISYLLDSIFFIDILINLKMAIITPYGMLISFHDTAFVYIKSFKFYIDMLAIFPFELISIKMELKTSQFSLLYSFLKCNRILNFFTKVPNIFKQKDEPDLKIEFKFALIKMFIYTIYANHFCACLIYISTCVGLRCFEGGWFFNINLFDDTIGHRYFISYYLALILTTTTGYGYPHPTNSIDIIITCIIIFIGVFIYTKCLFIIVEAITYLGASRANFVLKVTNLQKFMKDHKLSQKFQNKAINYYQCFWKLYRGYWLPGQPNLLEDLPVSIQQDINMIDIIPILANQSIFQISSKAFLRDLSLKVKMYLYLEGEKIINSQDFISQIYIIVKGIVSVHKDGIFCNYLSSSDSFGCTSSLNSFNSLYDFKTESSCEIYILNIISVWEVASNYPSMFKFFIDTASKSEFEDQYDEELRNIRDQDIKDEVNIIYEKQTDFKLKRKEEAFFGLIFFESGVIDDENYELTIIDNPDITVRIIGFITSRFAFYSGSPFIQSWKFLIIFCGLFFGFFSPIHASGLQINAHMWNFLTFLDIILYANIFVINPKKTYYNDLGVLVSHPFDLFIKYLKSNFFIDFISAFPFDYVVGSLIYGYSYHTYEYDGFYRINRMIQFYHVVNYFHILEEKSLFEVASIWRIKLFTYIVFGLNLSACLIMMSTCKTSPLLEVLINSKELMFYPNIGLECISTNWINNRSGFNLDEVVNFFYFYILSAYFGAMTFCLVGYGDFYSIEEITMFITMIIIAYGHFFMTYIVASAASVKPSTETLRAKFNQRINETKRFMKQENLNDELTQRVVNYYECIWNKTYGLSTSSLLTGLPPSFAIELTAELYIPILRKISVFKDIDYSFLKELAYKMRLVVIPKNEYILRKGAEADEIFIIWHGAAEFIHKSHHIIMAGQMIGLMHIMLEAPWSYSVKAIFTSDILCVSREDFNAAIFHYPQAGTHLFNSLKEFLGRHVKNYQIEPPIQTHDKNSMHENVQKKLIGDLVGERKTTKGSANYEIISNLKNRFTKKEYSNKIYLKEEDVNQHIQSESFDLNNFFSDSEISINQIQELTQIIENKSKMELGSLFNEHQFFDMAKKFSNASVSNLKNKHRSKNLISHHMDLPFEESNEDINVKFEHLSNHIIRRYSNYENIKISKTKSNSILYDLFGENEESYEDINSKKNDGHLVNTLTSENLAINSRNDSKVSFSNVPKNSEDKSDINSEENKDLNNANNFFLNNPNINYSNLNNEINFISNFEHDIKTKNSNSIGEFELNRINSEYMSYLLNLKKTLKLNIKSSLQLIDEESGFWKNFNIIINIVNLITVSLGSYQAFFMEYNSVFFLFNYLLDLFLIAEAILKFFVTYETAFGEKIVNNKLIIRNYLKTSFILDLMSFFPFEFCIVPFRNYSGIFDSPEEVIVWFRLNRLLRFIHLMKYTESFTKQIQIGTYSYLLWSNLVYTFLFIHSLACFMNIIIAIEKPMSFNPDLESYRATFKSNYPDKANSYYVFGNYIITVYWVIAIITATGFGDITAFSSLQMIACIVISVVGKLRIAFIISSFTSTLENASNARNEFNWNVKMAQKYLKDCNSSKKLINEVSSYMNFIWIRNNGVLNKSLFVGLPVFIQMDIAMELSRKMFKMISFLDDAEEEFLNQLAVRVCQMYITPGNYVIYKGDIGKEMYFIKKGTALINFENKIIPDDAMINENYEKYENIWHLKEGSIIGHHEVFLNSTYVSSVRAKTYLEILFIKNSDLYKVMEKFPITANKIHQFIFNTYNILIKDYIV